MQGEAWRVAMAMNALTFLIGAVLPLGSAVWLVLLH